MTFDAQSNVVRVVVEGREYEIPRAWMLGRAYTHEHAGMGPLEAWHTAGVDWHEQAEKHEAGR